MKKILITGGAGFIGYHLAKFYLASGGYQVTIVDNFFRGKEDQNLKELLKKSDINILTLDLLDPESYDRLNSGYDQVFHLAAVNGTKLFYDIPDQVLKTNTLSLIYLLEWFKKKNYQGKFCFTSSNEAYAGGLNAFNKLPIPTPENVPLVIEDTYNPRWSYGATKLIGEMFVIHYAQVNKFKALIVRPHNFYGPRAGLGHVIPEWCQKIIKRQDPFKIPGAEETRTFCYIDDAVRAMKMLMESEKTDGLPIATVHIGSTEEILIKDLSEKLFAVAGWRPEKIEYQPSLPGSVKRRLADITKIKKLVGWQPEIPLAEGLRKTFDWYEKNIS